MGISGRIARTFLQSQLTPLIALVALLLGTFAVIVTPKEEEPQINVTMANVFIPFPGASAKDVETLVATPAEQVLSQVQGLEHVYSVSRPGVAILTVQYKVGVGREAALVRLWDAIHANRDWVSAQLGVGEPIIKAKGIDDVPIVALTLSTADAERGAFDLERVAHAMEVELKRVPGTREVTTIGGPGRKVRVLLDADKLSAYNVSPLEIQNALQLSNVALPSGNLVSNNQQIEIQTGNWLENARDVANLVVGVSEGNPVYLSDVARIIDGPDQPGRYVWTGYGPAADKKFAESAEGNETRSQRADSAAGTASADDKVSLPSALAGGKGEQPAVTIAITKKPGENAVDVADALIKRVDELKGKVIPAGVDVNISRNYGETANDKAMKLIQKLVFATLSVVALVFFALGRREALIVGGAVVLTLAATLFASWAWGFTLNRVSLFALIFSIGILVDDAIVVVENIHRRRSLEPGKSLLQVIPEAVDEVGGPTILATFTVIAALLPMAFVSGLMGPYMSPIPINSSLGMVISLAIAFIVTPWLALKLTGKGAPESATALANCESGDARNPHVSLIHSGSCASSSSHLNYARDAASGAPTQHALSHDQEEAAHGKLAKLFDRVMSPFLDDQLGRKRRHQLYLGIVVAIVLSVSLAVAKLVVLKMLPFDNKSEFQVVVDMPAGTPLENTAAVLREMGTELAKVPEVTDYQAYAGTAAPINFNGLVRQYYLRQSSEMGDLQVNLIDKHHRSDQSHQIAQRVRPALEQIAQRHGAKVKVVEVPPGPPVMSPIVAEVYGPDEAGRIAVAKKVRQQFADTADIVAIDDSVEDSAPKRLLKVDQSKAAQLGVAQRDIVATMRIGLTGMAVTPLHDQQAKYEVPVVLTLPPEHQSGLDDLLKLSVKSAAGAMVPLSELVQVQALSRDKAIYHKDLLPVVYVMADMAGKLDSPLYGMFAARAGISGKPLEQGGVLTDYFIRQPSDPYAGYALKWDGEWQVTYETFRDMGAAYAVGLVLIYLLVVAQFKSYLTPAIIMAPIPLTIIGVMPGHALLGAQFTATSMIGMIALAGIIVRNSILLVDFINLQLASGVAFKQAVVDAAATRAKPIVLTGLAAMMGAFFILDDPIFNGLAIALIFGILVSTMLTLVLIPLLYYAAYRNRFTGQPQ